MATAAHSNKVRVVGTSTAFSNEATTKLTANTVYQLTDATKRRIDPSVAVVVQVDADGAGAGGYVTASASTYSFDYLFGRVTFLTDQGSSALVRISGNYLPALAVAEVREHSLNASATVLDTTTTDAAGWKQKRLGLKDISGSFKLLASPSNDLDAGAGTVKLETLALNGTPVLWEVERGGGFFRAWVVLSGLEQSGSVDGLIEYSVSFTGASQGVGASFSWS